MAGFDLAINFYDLPYLWSMVVAGIAGVVAVVALGVDLARSPWAGVAAKVRLAIYRAPERRAALFEEALRVDPGVPCSADPAAAS